MLDVPVDTPNGRLLLYRQPMLRAQTAFVIFAGRCRKVLNKVMIDPALGERIPALPTGGLLLDPTVKQVKDGAASGAFELASQNEDTLFIAFIGHGDHFGD